MRARGPKGPSMSEPQGILRKDVLEARKNLDTVSDVVLYQRQL